jgi:hypothetical protein
MHLGVARAADAEIRGTIGAAFFKLTHKIHGVAVGPARPIHPLHMGGDVTAQVLTAKLYIV